MRREWIGREWKGREGKKEGKARGGEGRGGEREREMREVSRVKKMKREEERLKSRKCFLMFCAFQKEVFSSV